MPRRAGRWLAAAALLLCALAAGPPARADESALERGQRLYTAGRLFPAEQAAREAIARDASSPEAHHLLGRVLLRRLRPDAAARALETAAALDPLRPGVWRDLGNAYFAAEDYERSRDALLRGIADAPNDGLLRLRLGLCELELGRYEAAAEAFERAAADPEVAQIALYHLGVARRRSGNRDAAREAFERAFFVDPPSALGGRAWTQVQALEQPDDPDRRWRIALGAGLLYDDNVTRQELDVTTEEPDGAGQFELAATYTIPAGDWPELVLGYDFGQTLHFDASELDLQSHGFTLGTSRTLGEVDASLGYLFSLNTLDGDRFLDLHDIRLSGGMALQDLWYASLSGSFRVKRFDDDARRDAEVGALGLLQLVALGDWRRYLLLGLDVDLEDASGSQFDSWGLATQVGLHLPLLVGERAIPLDARYRYRYRDYSNQTPSIGEDRLDQSHSVRLRLEIPLARRVSFRIEYEFVDAESNLPSADYRQNTVGGLLRFAM